MQVVLYLVLITTKMHKKRLLLHLHQKLNLILEILQNLTQMFHYQAKVRLFLAMALVAEIQILLHCLKLKMLVN